MTRLTSQEKVKRLLEENRVAELGGGSERINEQHKKGKLTARERISLLLDPDSFEETDKFLTDRASESSSTKFKPYGDGVVTGYGKINGRMAYVFAHDFTISGGSLGEGTNKKIVKIMDLALKNGAPIIGLNDSGGARIQEGVQSLAGVSELFFRNTLLSGVVPQISAVLGPCAGAAVYSPAMSDFIVMANGISNMFVTGPEVVKAAVGEQISPEELGGARVHSTESGVAHFYAENEVECFTLIRRLLTYLPQNNGESPPHVPAKNLAKHQDGDEIASIVPDDPMKTYDMRDLIRALVDDDEYLEISPGWAQNITIGLARLEGESVGIVGNQPLHLAGALDVDSSNKAARFIRFCDAFNIPIVTLVDVPGYLPGTEQEHEGLIRHGSKLLYAYCESTVPKVTLIVRKAYGGGYCAMGSKFSKADINYAWPTAEIAVMGPEAAVNIIFRKEMESSESKTERRSALVSEYREKFANPYVAASRGIIDDVIPPAMTRRKIINGLQSLRNKREFRPPKKHGNIQL